MSRNLATIQKISKIEPIKDADRIVKATILGWQCVTLKDEYKEGDEIIYCEIDSFLPIKPEFEFLRKSCYRKLENGDEGFRIKTIKLKKQVSQGLVLPITLLTTKGNYKSKDYKIGQDVTDELEIKLYQPPIPACLVGTVKGSFPSFMPKTDETRIQVLQDVLTRHKGKDCYITEKIDGSSITVYLKDGQFGVCSRNMELIETEGNAYWKAVRDLKIEEKMRELKLDDFALQGELAGQGIQCNPLNIEGRKVFWFNVFDIRKFEYLSFYEFEKIIKGFLELETVPILQTDYKLSDDINGLVELSKGKSRINKDKDREGIVIRPIREQVDLQMASGFGNGRLSFKAINPDYLLNEE